MNNKKYLVFDKNTLIRMIDGTIAGVFGDLQIPENTLHESIEEDLNNIKQDDSELKELFDKCSWYMNLLNCKHQGSFGKETREFARKKLEEARIEALTKKLQMCCTEEELKLLGF